MNREMLPLKDFARSQHFSQNTADRNDFRKPFSKDGNKFQSSRSEINYQASNYQEDAMKIFIPNLPFEMEQ